MMEIQLGKIKKATSNQFASRFKYHDHSKFITQVTLKIELQIKEKIPTIPPKSYDLTFKREYNLNIMVNHYI